jgi:hypothetical protein
MVYGSAVQKPITTADTIARGTVRAAFVHSSAICIEASSPPYMKQADDMPVIKHIPLGHPVVLVNSVQTNELDARPGERTNVAMNQKRNRPIDKATRFVR